MTIIVATEGMMVADSISSQGSVCRRVVRPKIVRNKSGWLAACAGQSASAVVFERWFMMDMLTGRPQIEKDSLSVLLMDPDGKVWRMDESLMRYRQEEPAVLGHDTAEAFVLGAMAAGASAERAVELCCDYVVWTCGPVQVERIGET